MEYTVESRDCRLHVYDTMGDGPILLIMHGVATDGSFFRKTAEILKDSYRVISYDRRGHSASIAGEDASYTAHQQALDAAAILNRAGAGSADVAACSAGGIVALELARTCPDRVRRLFPCSSRRRMSCIRTPRSVSPSQTTWIWMRTRRRSTMCITT